MSWFFLHNSKTYTTTCEVQTPPKKYYYEAALFSKSRTNNTTCAVQFLDKPYMSQLFLENHKHTAESM